MERQILTTPWGKEIHMDELGRIVPIDFILTKHKYGKMITDLGLTIQEESVTRAIVTMFSGRLYSCSFVKLLFWWPNPFAYIVITSFVCIYYDVHVNIFAIKYYLTKLLSHSEQNAQPSHDSNPGPTEFPIFIH